MRQLVQFLFTTVLLALVARGADAEMPLFADFKAFCVNTGARPDAIKTAVEAAGGALKRPTSSTTWPQPMRVTIWNHIQGGRELTISAGSMTVRGNAYRPASDSDACTLFSFGNEDVSLAAIQKWIGVKPTRVEPDEQSITWYDYQQVGSEHLAMPQDVTAYRAIETEGRAWHVMVLQSHHDASVQFVHDLPPTRSSP